jgi:hypothetical protein
LIDSVLDEAARPPWFAELPHIALSGLLTFDECFVLPLLDAGIDRRRFPDERVDK